MRKEKFVPILRDLTHLKSRLKLLKLGAQVRMRRLHFALASGCPNKIEFKMAYLYLRRAFKSS
jgi:hypothetical protein